MSTAAQTRPISERSHPSATALISPDNYSFLQRYIYSQSGIVLDSEKHYLVEARLMPIVREQKLESLDELCGRIRSRSSVALEQVVVEAMTTNETLFFRDIAPFEALRNHIIPQLKEQWADARKLSIWSAAASSGQEAYSLAMMLLELGLSHWDIEILGTDLSVQILDRARAGRFMQIEVNRGLPAKYLVKYFERAGIDWQLKDEVRRMVRFRPFDLRQSMSALGSFDIVLCRNVLIYFDVETKKKILGQIRRVLLPGGYLILGGAETTLNLDDNFKRTQVGPAVLYRVP
jgi:chemotaxis protein methyltransferase CheR